MQTLLMVLEYGVIPFAAGVSGHHLIGYIRILFKISE